MKAESFGLGNHLMKSKKIPSHEELASQVLESPEVKADTALLKEAEARFADIQSGKTKTIPLEDVMKRYGYGDPSAPLVHLKGMLRKTNNPVTIEQMNQAIEQGGAKGTQQLDTKKAIE